MSASSLRSSRSFVRPLREVCRRLLVKGLLRLLRRLDDSLETSHENSIQGVPSSPSARIAPEPGMRAGNTLLLQAGGSFFGVEALRLLAGCIFETDNFSPFQEEIFQDALREGSSVVHPAELEERLGRLLAARQAGPHADAATDGLAKLIAHRRKTEESRRAYLPAAHSNPSAVFWPDPTLTKDARSLFNDSPFAREYKFISRDTAIGSAGSCFAMEIAHRLQKQGFNYLVTEPGLTEGAPADACARWGTIFNVPSLRQLVERSFGLRQIPPLAWSQERDGKKVYFDPFREDLTFSSLEELERSWNQHLLASRRALESVDVFVMTLGMNEIWRLKSDGTVFSRAPWRVAPELVEKKVLTVEENLCDLQKMLDQWRLFNPKLKLILSVSPVPLHATFRADEYHVIAANAHSKATLRVVADEFVRRNRDVFYFPSYEVVMYTTKEAWQPDQRHVSRAAVDNVMRLFDRIFVRA